MQGLRYCNAPTWGTCERRCSVARPCTHDRWPAGVRMCWLACLTLETQDSTLNLFTGHARLCAESKAATGDEGRQAAAGGTRCPMGWQITWAACEARCGILQFHRRSRARQSPASRSQPNSDRPPCTAKRGKAHRTFVRDLTAMPCCRVAPQGARQTAGSSRRPPAAAARRQTVAAAWGKRKGGGGGLPRPPSFMQRLGKDASKSDDMDLVDARQQVGGAEWCMRGRAGGVRALACAQGCRPPSPARPPARCVRRWTSSG